MPQTRYNIQRIDPQTYDAFRQSDVSVVETFDINSTFKPFEHKVEVNVFTLDNILLASVPNYTEYKLTEDAQTDNDGTVDLINIDPINDVNILGFSGQDVRLTYNFVDDLYSDSKVPTEFFIEEISGDRTEIRLLTTRLKNEDVERYTNELLEDIKATSYLNDFRLNFNENKLVVAVNVATQEYRDITSVVVKLANPLPEEFGIKSLCRAQKLVSDSIAYNVFSEYIPDEITVPYLRGANFNIDTEEDAVVTTDFLNYNQLFDFPVSNTYRELNSLFAEKSIPLSIEYTDFNNFIHFSSAYERIKNFQYKLNLITSYQTSYSASFNASNNSYAFSGSADHWKSKINTILNNFDHYDRFLYYDSSSYSWPKQNNTKPYIVATGSATASVNDLLLSASNYDASNYSILTDTIPEFLREDPDNAPYNLFTDMVGQHFDNIWVYTKALSDKYDGDNRLTKGAAAGLIEPLLKNFGVKLYNSNRSIEDLFKNFTGQFYDSGSESLKSTMTITTASNSPVSEETYRNEINKRLYHNLPLLIKSKGTHRGIRALLNSFGIPGLFTSGSHTGLHIRSFGGGNKLDTVNFGSRTYTSGSDNKVRLDDTGSIIPGSSLSVYSSIVKRDKKYSDDLHGVDIGYSPNDHLNQKVYDFYSASGFNIDNYIGDPRERYDITYASLFATSSKVVGDLMTGSTFVQSADYLKSGSHVYDDLIRNVKFFDNVIFKTVKDFLPARSTVSTGIIIKPHVLERNKIKQIQVSGSQQKTVSTVDNQGDLLITGSIDILELTGSSGGAFGTLNTLELANPLTASYTASVMTPDGLQPKFYHNHEEARYDGELSGSNLKPNYYPGELNRDNNFKKENPDTLQYKIELYKQGIDVTPTPTPSVTVTITPTPTITVTPTITPTTTPSPSVDCSESDVWVANVYVASCSSPIQKYITKLQTTEGIAPDGCYQVGDQVEVNTYNACDQTGGATDYYAILTGTDTNKTPTFQFKRNNQQIASGGCTGPRSYTSC